VRDKNNVDFPDWICLDLKYIDRSSLAIDLKILAMTIPAMLVSRGAY
jgi:lipopolysaccharide/colanic/teichoic acid biosynthesis glycosyltransferase